MFQAIKIFLPHIVLFVGATFSSKAFPEFDAGVVIMDHYRCPAGLSDRIVVQTEKGLTNAQVYSGYSSTHEGRLIYGELNSYGFTEIYDESGEEVGRIYVDDYMIGNRTAAIWCFED